MYKASRDDLRTAIGNATSLTVLTGAGMSAESGVPTFRAAHTGLWARYSPEELATPQAFENDPVTVWRWYQWRRKLVARARCHAGHRALGMLQERLPRFSLITQNVDGLHQQAGCRDVIEFHGSLQRDRCHDCGRETAADATLDTPPACDSCGGLYRPAVVWFGETIPTHAIQAADEACNTGLFLVVGTAGAVYPAAGLVGMARRRGARIGIINTEATELDGMADWCWRAPASALAELV